jgi:hypothetical protein
VAIVSLGEPRPLLLRPREGGGKTLRVPLGHGDLIVMGGSCQRTWDHAIPKTRADVGGRISVQYRPRGVSLDPPAPRAPGHAGLPVRVVCCAPPPGAARKPAAPDGCPRARPGSARSARGCHEGRPRVSSWVLRRAAPVSSRPHHRRGRPGCRSGRPPGRGRPGPWR